MSSFTGPNGLLTHAARKNYEQSVATDLLDYMRDNKVPLERAIVQGLPILRQRDTERVAEFTETMGEPFRDPQGFFTMLDTAYENAITRARRMFDEIDRIVALGRGIPIEPTERPKGSDRKYGDDPVSLLLELVSQTAHQEMISGGARAVMLLIHDENIRLEDAIHTVCNKMREAMDEEMAIQSVTDEEQLILTSYTEVGLFDLAEKARALFSNMENLVALGRNG